MPGQDKTKYKKSSTKDNRDQANEFASVKKKNKIKQANEFSGTGKSSKRAQVNEFSGLGKKKETIKQANEFSGTSKTSKTKVQPPKLRPKNLKKKEKNSDSKKSKIVTEKMLADSPFTSLRDYLNNRDGKKRRDGKKVELKSGKTKTAKMSAKASNDAQSTQKVISKKTQTDFKKSGAFKGTDGAPGDNKKPKIKRKSTSNIIGNKNFVSDKKKKK